MARTHIHNKMWRKGLSGHAWVMVGGTWSPAKIIQLATGTGEGVLVPFQNSHPGFHPRLPLRNHTTIVETTLPFPGWHEVARVGCADAVATAKDRNNLNPQAPWAKCSHSGLSAANSGLLLTWAWIHNLSADLAWGHCPLTSVRCILGARGRFGA